VLTEREMIETNRANWDARVPVHLGGYDLDHLRDGGQRLADFEYAAIDVAGRDVLHMHRGMAGRRSRRGG
jgi:hypothetical protein